MATGQFQIRKKLSLKEWGYRFHCLNLNYD